MLYVYLYLFKIVLRNSEYFFIMKGTFWILVVLFKEEKFYRIFSEFIANNYILSVSDFKLKDLLKLTRIKIKCNFLIIELLIYIWSKVRRYYI